MAMALDSDGDKINYREFNSFVVRLNWPNQLGKPLTLNITTKHRLNYSPVQTALWDSESLLPRRFQGN